MSWCDAKSCVLVLSCHRVVEEQEGGLDGPSVGGEVR